jgi:hypothetical protein
MRKVTVTLPISLLARLDDSVPSRGRSAFIARAIEEQLALMEQAAALEASAGAWRDQDYPDLDSEQEIDRWLAGLRGPARDRLGALSTEPEEKGEAT